MSKKVVSYDGNEKVWKIGDRQYRKHCMPTYISTNDGLQYFFNYYDRTIIINLIDRSDNGISNIRKGGVDSSLIIYSDGRIC